MNGSHDLHEVYAPLNSAQVVLLQQLLEDAGIRPFVVNDNMEGVAGEVPFNYARPRIWVRTSDALAARRICEAFDRRLSDREQGTGADKTPFCYYCGETLAKQAQQCPACSAVL